MTAHCDASVLVQSKALSKRLVKLLHDGDPGLVEAMLIPCPSEHQSMRILTVSLVLPLYLTLTFIITALLAPLWP